MMRASSILAGAALTALAPGAQADEISEERAGLFTLVVENDLFGQRDRNYTSGVKVAWLTPDDAEPQWVRNIADATPPFGSDVDVRIEFEIGQSLFTPEDLTLPTPNPRDRPYAALMYGSVGILADTDRTTFDALQLLVGMVGPSAQGQEIQRGLHRAIDGVMPEGWESQVPDRVVGAIRYQRAARLVKNQDGGWVDFDIAPAFGFSLGNLQTSAGGGFNFRVGQRLPRDFGPPRIAPSPPGSGYFVPQAQWGWYAFGGVEARYTAYDVTLDERGANGAKVTRKPQGGDAQLGLAVHFKDVRLAYTQVVRTREFKELPDPLSEFGALSITWRR